MGDSRSFWARTPRIQAAAKAAAIVVMRGVSCGMGELPPQGDRDAVAGGIDGGEEALVREEPPGELLDPLGGRGAVALALEHPSRPQDVVADEEASGAEVLVRQVDGGRIAVLVDVVVDDVPRAADAAQRGGGLLAVVGDAAPDAGAAEEALGEPDVVLRQLRAVDHARLSH